MLTICHVVWSNIMHSKSSSMTDDVVGEKEGLLLALTLTFGGVL